MYFRSVVAWLLPVITMFSLTGCEIINPKEDTPAYLKINKITLDTRRNASETYGSASNNITDAWVFANEKMIGVFQLPATIPVLAKDSVRITVYAGVYGDGMKTARFPYGFYTSYIKTVFMEPGKSQTLEPVVKFSDRTKFPFDIYEDFTNFSGLSAFRLRGSSPYKLEDNRDSLANFPYANGDVGVVYEKPGIADTIVLESLFNGKLNSDGNLVFLEMDYRSTMDLKVGVTASLAGQSEDFTDLVLLANRNWNKTYVNLTDEATFYKGANFRIIIKALPGSNPKDYLALDNIRLLQIKP